MPGPLPIRLALLRGVQALKSAGICDPARDARLLMAEALGVEPSRLSALIGDPLADPARFEALIARRAGHEPVSKILGRREFYGRSFAIAAEVLDPRPETELLVDLALAQPFERVLDLGTGSGCILVSLLAERPAATGTGADISPAALEIAAANARTLGVADRAAFVHSDWFAAVEGRFDLIVSNPPYIAASEMPGLAPEVRDWDPACALSDGADGLSAYRAILAGAGRHLAPAGRLLVEIGWTQGPAVSGLFRRAGYAGVGVHRDLAGHDRVVTGLAPDR